MGPLGTRVCGLQLCIPRVAESGGWAGLVPPLPGVLVIRSLWSFRPHPAMHVSPCAWLWCGSPCPDATGDVDGKYAGQASDSAGDSDAIATAAPDIGPSQLQHQGLGRQATGPGSAGTGVAGECVVGQTTKPVARISKVVAYALLLLSGILVDALPRTAGPVHAFMLIFSVDYLFYVGRYAQALVVSVLTVLTVDSYRHGDGHLFMQSHFFFFMFCQFGYYLVNLSRYVDEANGYSGECAQ
jgi:hypothetical protein